MGGSINMANLGLKRTSRALNKSQVPQPPPELRVLVWLAVNPAVLTP